MTVMGNLWIARKARDLVLQRVLGKRLEKGKVAMSGVGGVGRTETKEREHWPFDLKVKQKSGSGEARGIERDLE